MEDGDPGDASCRALPAARWHGGVTGACGRAALPSCSPQPPAAANPCHSPAPPLACPEPHVFPASRKWLLLKHFQAILSQTRQHGGVWRAHYSC